MKLTRYPAKREARNSETHDYFNGDIDLEKVNVRSGEVSIRLEGFNTQLNGAYEVYLSFAPSEVLEILKIASVQQFVQQFELGSNIRNLHSKIAELQAQVQSLTQKDGT